MRKKPILEIIKIEDIPKWKFWKIDRDQITIKVDGVTKTFSLFQAQDETGLLVHWCINKALGKQQWGRRWLVDADEIYEQFNKKFGTIFVKTEQVLGVPFEFLLNDNKVTSEDKQ